MKKLKLRGAEPLFTCLQRVLEAPGCGVPCGTQIGFLLEDAGSIEECFTLSIYFTIQFGQTLFPFVVVAKEHRP